MRPHRTFTILLAAVLAIAGCATRDWVRELVGKKDVEIDQRFAGVPLLQKPVQLEALEEVLLSQLRRPGTAAPSRFWEGKSQRQQINP